MKRMVLLSVLAMTPWACRGPVEAPVDRAAELAGPPMLEELRNATYRGLEETDGPVTLTEGRWMGEPFEPGAASRPVVSFVRDFHVLGDLNGDGLDEAVVMLAHSSGGSGTGVSLAVVERTADGLENVATALLGDRVQVRGVRVRDGRLRVDVLRAGPGDAACCPGELATVGYTLADGELVPFDPGVAPTRLSLGAIEGTEWVLRAWAWDEPAPDDPEVTLQYQEGQLAGQSGCNRYFASVKETGETPGALAVGRGAGTRMACPDPAAAIEARFLQQLEDVSRFGFVAGQLVLSYQSGETGGAMLFDGREVSTP